MIGTLQQESIDQLYEQLKEREEALQFYLERITVLDLKKRPHEAMVETVDTDVVELIDVANNRILDKQAAYQDRIDSPCRTDLFWRVVGIRSDTVETKGGTRERLFYDLECYRLSENGYRNIVVFNPDRPNNRFYRIFLARKFGLDIDYDDGTKLQRVTPTGIEKNPTSERFALEKENFFGAKFFDQPLTHDVFDAFVGDFTGIVGAGSTVITSINSQFFIPDAGIGTVGNFIRCKKAGVIGINADSTATIVGIGTTSGSLARRTNLISGIGSAQVTSTSVYSIDIEEQGGGYTFGVAPAVFIDPPGNVGASATATVSAGGSISSFTITNSGLGYTVAPTVEIFPPANGSAVGFGTTGALGAVIGVTTDSAGSGYIQVPNITFADPTTYSFNSNSQIDAATNRITLGGGTQPYENDTQIRYNVGAGNAEGNSFGLTDQTVYFVVNADGTSIQVAATQGGSAINLSTTSASETNFFQGLTATGTINVLPNGTVGFVTITSGGSGYTDDPAISYSTSGIATATATAVLTGDSVTSIVVGTAGSGYSFVSPPTVTISEPSNAGAAATVTVSIGGTIESFNITDPGAGYRFAPKVTVGPPFDEVLNTYTIDNQTTGSADYPEADGREVTFTIIRSPEDVKSVTQPFFTNPLTPQTIGIMDLSNIGIGTMIKLDRSGISSASRTWRPELISLGSAYREPAVGADHIYHRIGLDHAPITDPANPTSYATEGQKLTLIADPPSEATFTGFKIDPPVSSGSVPVYAVTDFAVALPGCASTITNALNDAITAASNAVSETAGKDTELKDKMEFSNAVRKGRDDINLQIHSMRGMLGELEREVRELKNALRFTTSNIGITTYNTGNNMNAGINTTPARTYTIGTIQINAFD